MRTAILTGFMILADAINKGVNFFPKEVMAFIGIIWMICAGMDIIDFVRDNLRKMKDK